MPAILLLLTACNKKDPAPAPAPPSNPPAPAATYYGRFSAQKFVFWTDTFYMGQAYNALVILTSTPRTDVALASYGENLGAVKSNSVQLRFEPNIGIYLDSTGTLSYPMPISFQHTSTALGSINYTSADTFPTYPLALVKQIKDTLDKTKNFTVPLTGVAYYTNATCIMFNGSAVLTGVSKSALPGASGFTFTPQETSGLTSGNYYFLRLILQKNTDQTFNGKLFRFTNETYSDFSVYVK